MTREKTKILQTELKLCSDSSCIKFWPVIFFSYSRISPHFRETELSNNLVIGTSSQINSVHIFSIYFFKTNFNIIFLPTPSLPSGLFPSAFPTSLYLVTLISFFLILLPLVIFSDVHNH